MDKNSFAPTPPMGWNSWDCYGASVTEEDLLRNADYMAEHLKKYGWEYIICDIQWYEPTADSSHYHKFADLCMDEYGRVIPAPNRFPSAADGKGFGSIADYIHGKGLKFGIHIMRGIPRQAVAANTPVKGTDYTARDVAHPNSICCWNTDMYGVDAAKPGAQEYYDSILELYASWGVDYIKADDICVKYARANDESTLSYGGDEIELLHRAIAKCGRPIVLSLSPGPAMVEQAAHLREHANMWRITNDLWDEWGSIMEMFGRCNDWSSCVSPGCYPDCDMLPIGHLSIRGCEHGVCERQTRLSREEQRTMLTLWCIFGSPLMIGCELTDMDDWTKDLLTNTEVIRLLQNGKNAHQVLRSWDLIVWQAEDEDCHYVALFNTVNWSDLFAVSFYRLGLSGSFQVHELWTGEDLGAVSEKLTVRIDAHDAKLYCLKKL
ncbi:MAG: glycoside hydrolase family 27 protein [Lachnospiraceae bacterium]|nr:glycoside hydrolase family 27 protein [Lachnospiraceae bacterium]